MFKKLFIMCLFCLCACAKPQTVIPIETVPEIQPLPIPEDLEDNVSFSSAMGYQIYKIDYFSALGTDVLLENIQPGESSEIKGYLTLQEGDINGNPLPSWQVVFYNGDNPPAIIHRVIIPESEPEKATYTHLDPPEPVMEVFEILIQARQEAIEYTAPHQQMINPVILPGDSFQENSILVYLLAGTTEPDVVLMGSHHRVIIPADGEIDHLVYPGETFAMEKPDLESTEELKMIITNSVTDYPLEFHVFSSLYYDMPIYVITERGIWLVNGTKITLEDDEITIDGLVQ